MATLFQGNKPKHRLFNRTANGEEAVILEKCGFVVAERFGDVLAFFLCEHDAIEGGVKNVVVV